MILRFFILVFVVTLTLQGDEISTLISKIQHSKSSQKRLLVNELKLKLKGVKASKRAEVIAKLRKGAHFKHKRGLHNSNRTHKKLQRGKTTSSTQNHQQRGHK